MSEKIKLNVTVDHKRYYDAASMWGVYGVRPNTNEDKIETLDWKGIFAISGNTPDLVVGDSYDIEIEPSYNKKYGKGYSIVAVSAKRPETAQEQRDYIQMFVTDKQFDEIIRVYPNEKILDLMEEDEFDYNKIHGLGEKSYNKIKEVLFSNLEAQEALLELKDLDISFNSMKKLIEYFGSAAQLVQVTKDNIYRLCEVSGFGFKKVDSYALNRGDSPESKERIFAGLHYILEQDASSGHSWLEKNRAINQAVTLLEINKGYITDFIEELSLDDKFIYVDDNSLALKRNYNYEKDFYNKLKTMLSTPSKTKVNNLEEKINSLEENNGFTFTDEQREAIKKSVENNVLIINGKGGVGKSTLLSSIVKILQDYTYMSVALSGKAVQVLRDNDLEAKTIHKMLIERQIDEETGKAYPVPYDIIIVDESSMVNNFLFNELVQSMRDNAKLIVVGDNGQLPAIGTGANFDNLIRFGKTIPRQELTIVHRQAQKSGILSVANDIREGEQINSRSSYETEIYGELKDMVLIPVDKETDIKQMIIDIAERNKNKNLFEFQIISGRVDSGDISVYNLNLELQKVFNDVSKPHVSRNGYEFRVGDKIIQNGNNYEALLRQEEFSPDKEEFTEVFNGTLGIIEGIEFDKNPSRKNHKVHIRFEGESRVVEYDLEDLNQIGLAYALTTHKLQGSGFKQVVFAFDGSSYMLLCKEFIYTGITRAKEGCIMIAENNMLHMGIKKSQGSNRRTFLKNFLTDESINK